MGDDPATESMSLKFLSSFLSIFHFESNILVTVVITNVLLMPLNADMYTVFHGFSVCTGIHMLSVGIKEYGDMNVYKA